MNGPIVRSKFATDIMWRLYDQARNCWVYHNGKSIWASKGSVEKVCARLVSEDGRSPETLSVERVTVEVI